MIQASPSQHPGRGTDDPFISIDVLFELARLRASEAYDKEGHAGRTLTKYRGLRVVLETMKAGVRLPFHETAEETTLQVVLGQLRIWMRYGENCDLSEASFAAIEARRVHEIEALHDCAFLLTLAWPPVTRRAGGAEDDEMDGAGI